MVPRIYSILISLYGFLIWVLSPFHEKARRWRDGRHKIWVKIKKDSASLSGPVWIHAASLGEFEQGRPVIEAIKKEYPDTQVILTFFSPSGYEIRKDYPYADKTYYLPLDTASNARDFLDLIQPQLAIFVKYDFWFNYLNALAERKIPFFFLSVVFRPDHFLFKKWAVSLLKILKKTNQLFVQDQKSYDLLLAHGLPCTLTGDTRIDRVITLQSELRKYPPVEKATQGKRVLILGSIWSNDLEIIADWINAHQDKYFIIAAPHDISPVMLQKIRSKLHGSYLLLSDLNNLNENHQGLIIDSIGDLAHLYQYGDLAYIGGGFGKGIHSILEPIAAGIPVVFGPNHQQFNEASELISLSSAISISNASSFENAIQSLEDPDTVRLAKMGIQQFLSHHQGATSKVVHYLAAQKYLS